MILVTADTSVVVPAVLGWHEQHEVAAPAVRDVDRLPSHVLAEAYSVLTRLPHGLSLTPRDASDLLLDTFPEPPLLLEAREHCALLTTLAAAGIRGGAVYDALVGAIAVRASALLLTLDGRAARAYQTVGVNYRVPA